MARKSKSIVRGYIYETRDYTQFENADGNRPFVGRVALSKSLKAIGFIWAFPVVCRAVWRDGHRKLQVMDGWQRVNESIALQIPICYTITNQTFDIAAVNSTRTSWSLADYINRFVEIGKSDYITGKQFCDRFGINYGVGFGLLADLGYIKNHAMRVKTGQFAITAQALAERVAHLYTQFLIVNKDLRGNALLNACIAVHRVASFEQDRLLKGLRHNPGILKRYTNRDDYLAMLEELYNFRRAEKMGLRVAAINAMRARRPADNTASHAHYDRKTGRDVPAGVKPTFRYQGKAAQRASL